MKGWLCNMVVMIIKDQTGIHKVDASKISIKYLAAAVQYGYQMEVLGYKTKYEKRGRKNE